MKVNLISKPVCFGFELSAVAQSTFQLRFEVEPYAFQSHSMCKKCEPLCEYLAAGLKVGECDSADRFLEVRISLASKGAHFSIKIEGDPLEELYHLLESKGKAWIILGMVEIRKNSMRAASHTRTKRMEIQRLDNLYFCEGVMYRPSDWWKNNDSDGIYVEISGNMYIQVCVDDMPAIESQTPVPIHSNSKINEIDAINKELLEKQIGTDMQIIASNGTTVACHKCFVQVHSTKFPIWTKNGRSKLQLLDMTENGVKALLKYMYCREIDQVESNPSLALELLICANRFDLEHLKSLTTEIVLASTGDCYTTEQALELLHLSFKMRNDTSFREKSLVNLESKRFEDVRQASNFERLCSEFPGFQKEVKRTLLNIQQMKEITQKINAALS